MARAAFGQIPAFFPLNGGLDLVTPAIAKPAGRAIAGMNYEPHPKGYARVQGYERFDGRQQPSEASYWIIDFTAGSAAIVAGEAVAGATSGATGTALLDAVVESGDYGTGDAAGFLVLTGVDGAFVAGEAIEAGGSARAVAGGAARRRGAADDATDATYHQAAIEAARSAIAPVPGGGPVRGVWAFNGDVYAFRDDAAAGATACKMYKATAAGWAECAFGREIAFTGGGTVQLEFTSGGLVELEFTSGGLVELLFTSGGTYQIQVGDTIGGASSGATAKVVEVILTGGTWAGGDAAGRLVIADKNGGFQAENLNVGSNSNVATIAGDSLLIASILAGDTITGATSGATAKVGAVFLDSGAWTNGNAAGRLLIFDKTGAFQAEELDLGAVTGVATIAGDSTLVADIQAGDTITGAESGATAEVESVTVSSGAFASGNAAGTLLIGNKEGTFEAGESLNIGDDAGVAVASGDSTLLAEIEEGDTITGATSGATAAVRRVVVESGAWETGDAAGRLILDSQAGVFQAEALNVGADTNVATIVGDSVAISLLPGGQFEFVNHNFYGAAARRRMYGCDGVNPAFEWDGEVLVPLRTGMENDAPIWIAEHKNHLFLAFPGGSLQHSGVANPYAWQVVLGAGEIGLGEEITGLVSSTLGHMVIFGRNKVSVLYGDDAANWDLKPLSADSGAIARTAQQVGGALYLDDAGLRTVNATQNYGDFRIGTLTTLIDPLLRTKKKARVSAVGSLRVRGKDQYRLFWSDGTGIAVYFGRKMPEILPFDLGKVARCLCAGEDASGDELLLMGSDDGYVYRLDSGTSFDGAAINAYLRLPFNHVGSPTHDKRWHKATLEVDAAPSTRIGLMAEFSYGASELPATETGLIVRGGGGFWDEAAWDEFYWSSPVEGLAEAHIDGLGRNVSILIVSNATYEEPHVLHGLTLHYSPRRLLR